MATLEMGRMRNRYRLSPSRLSEKQRLDRIVDSMLAGVLEQALQAGGLDITGEVCIRRLDVPVRVRLSGSDIAIAAAWSRAITAAVTAAVAQGDQAVVAYASVRHGLLDMAAGVARGELSRAWAWSRLGLWPRPNAMVSAAAVDELVGSLEARPIEVLPALVELARLGLLRALADRMVAGHWSRLARARASLAGLAETVTFPAEGEGPGPETEPGELAAGTAPTSRLAAELAAHSAIFAALAEFAPVRKDREMRHAVAVLAVLEVEPAVAAHGAQGAAQLIAAIGRLLAGEGRPAGVTPDGGEAPDATTASDGETVAPAEQPAPGSDAATGEGPQRADDGQPSAPAPARAAGDAVSSGAVPGQVAGGELGPDEGSITGSGVEAEPDPVAGGQVEPEPPPLDPRRRAWTQAGGLLFLVHLVERLGLPERLLTTTELDGRPLVWSLHRLAMLLCGLADDDAAALAFCGLGPDVRPPARDAEPATAEELAALEAVGAELTLVLADALERRLEPPASVLAEVSARRAEVVSDLGWMEVHFALDDVSLEVRRAGLDLDPGWVPWLGVVLRFVYG